MALCRRVIRENEDNRQDGGLPEMAKQCLCHAYHFHTKKRAPKVRCPFVYKYECRLLGREFLLMLRYGECVDCDDREAEHYEEEGAACRSGPHEAVEVKNLSLESSHEHTSNDRKDESS